MDPVTALGLACNVLQVVETGLKVTKQIKQIRERGSLAANDELEKWASEVSKDNTELQKELNTKGSKLTPSDFRIRQLAQDTIRISDELKRTLNQVAFAKRQAGKKANALQQVFRTHIKKSKIDQLNTQLQVCKAALDRTIIRDLYVRCDEDRILTKASFSTLSTGQQSIIQRIIDSNAQSLTTTTKAVKETEANTIRQTVRSEDRLHTHMQSLHVQDVDQRKLQRLLNSLHFESINQRQNYIQQRVGNYGKTLSWIFEPNQKHNFHEWLACGHGLYWISGKPGSGKSSLVDYIVQHLHPGKNAYSLLEIWASPTSLKVLTFFFYRPATDQLQKTFEGLWRSLCYQMLWTDNALCKTVLNDQNVPVTLKQHISPELEHKSQWMTKDLETFFLYLVSKTESKLFILLDGLDEFVDNHGDLLNTVKRLSQIPKLKVCCSSRPDQPFEAGLADSAGLKLQGLMWNDISIFVNQRLANTRASKLAEHIVHRAEGVFLWAHLVTEDICRGIPEGADLDELWHRITDAPSDMNGLFVSMLERVHGAYTKRPKPFLQYIFISLMMREDILLSELLFTDSDQRELDECLRDGFSAQFIRRLNTKAETLQAQVIARCAGLVQLTKETLLEPPKYGKAICQTSFSGPTGEDVDHAALEQISRTKVQFIHRTAFDFLEDDPTGQKFVGYCSTPEEEAHLNRLRANVAMTGLGLDHILEGITKYPVLVPNRLYKVWALQIYLEAHGSTHLGFHVLTDHWIDKLLRDFELIPGCPASDLTGFMGGVEIKLWHSGLPLHLAARFSYACEYSLHSYIMAHASSLSLEERQLLISLVWSYMIPWPPLQFGSERVNRIRECVKLMDTLQRSCAASIKPTTILRGFVKTMRHNRTHVLLPETPIWIFIMLRLVEETTMSAVGNLEKLQLMVREAIATLNSEEILLTEAFELTLWSFENYSAVNAVPGDVEVLTGPSSTDYAQLTIRCTVESMVSLLLPGIGFPEWGLSGVGPLPYGVRWKPKNLDRCYVVQESQESQLWVFEDGRFRLNRDYQIRLTDKEFSELSEQESPVLFEYHEEMEPGCFKWRPRRRPIKVADSSDDDFPENDLTEDDLLEDDLPEDDPPEEGGA